MGEPDLRSPEEARQYLVKLRSILQYLGVSTGNMEEGSFRCDANISIRPRGSDELMTRAEVKNMNSFRAVYRALQFEVERQTARVEAGHAVEQETRGWVEERGETVSMRSKEYAHDYRYFPEPDLPPLSIARAWVEQVAEGLPELPDAKKARFMDQYGLSEYDASLLTISPDMARFYEDALQEWEAAHGPSAANGSIPKATANWTITELGRLLNAAGTEIENSPLRPAHLAELLSLLEQGTIGTAQAKVAFEEMFNTGKAARTVVEELGLAQITGYLGHRLSGGSSHPGAPSGGRRLPEGEGDGREVPGGAGDARHTWESQPLAGGGRAPGAAPGPQAVSLRPKRRWDTTPAYSLWLVPRGGSQPLKRARRSLTHGKRSTRGYTPT